jgi:hypothetical protein
MDQRHEVGHGGLLLEDGDEALEALGPGDPVEAAQSARRALRASCRRAAGVWPRLISAIAIGGNGRAARRVPGAEKETRIGASNHS